MVCMMIVRRIRFPRGRVLLGLVLMGGLGYVGQSFTYFTALTMASAGLVALLLFLYPAIVTLLAALIFKDRLTVPKMGAVLLALIGTVLTIGPTGSGHTLGIVLGIAAALIYSIYILAGSRITPQAGSIPTSTIVMISAAIGSRGIGSGQGPAFPVTPLGWAAIVAFALTSPSLAFV